MKTKQFLSLLLMAALVLTLLPVTAFAATAQTIYVDKDGNTQAVEATVLDSSSGGSILTGWYVVNGNITISNIQMGGAGLILSDGCELTVPGGAILSGCTIYGQEKGTGRLTATGGDNRAGITGDTASALTINGGVITATGGSCGAGIGGNFYTDGFGKVEINGGIVTATGGAGGAGIGGGYVGNGGNRVIINGGTVTAIGGASFTGALNGVGAGIGGGGGGDHEHVGGNSGDVYINGGSVYARAGGPAADNIGVGGRGTLKGNLAENVTSPAREVKEIPVILHGAAAGMRVDSITFVNLDYTYGIKDIRTGENGTVYLYLYLDNNPIDVTAVRIIDEEGNPKTYTGTRYIAGWLTYSADLYPNTPPDITTTSLPDGREGVSYNQQLEASARPAPTWSISNGSLPGDLTLSESGVISGVPTENGSFNIQVKAVNTEGEDTQDLSLTIGESAGKYEITFYANNGTDATTKQIGYKGEPEKLKQNTFTREGFLFDRWTTEPDGGGTAYDDQQAVIFAVDTNLYAQWTNPTNTVTFDKNGGGTEAYPNTADVEYGKTAALPSTNPTRGGFTFGGWNTEADGTGTDFTASTPVYRDVTVYAVWFENLTAGGGTETSPYLISTAEQLHSMAFFVNSDNAAYGDKYYRLTADINLGASWTTSDGADATLTSGRAWTAIGSGGPSPVPFTGSFDGDYHTISGLYINQPGQTYAGLFGYAQGATIENVGVVASYIKCGHYVGGVVGYADRTAAGRSTTIHNCYNQSTVSAEARVGGVVGWLEYGSVTACYNTGTVIGCNVIAYAGGVVGVLDTGTKQNQIKDCYNVGEISGGRYIGGICGYAYTGGKISNCYNSGSIGGTSAVGGVVGVSSSILTDCVALGRSVSGGSDVGRVVGSGGGALTDNYAWDGMTVTVSGANKNPLDTGTDKLDGADLLVVDGVLYAAEGSTPFDWVVQGFTAGNGWELPVAKWKLPRLTALGGDFPDMPRKPDKTLVSVTTPAAITGVANGTAKTAYALGLPTKVTLVTNGGNAQADVTWDVDGCAFDPGDTAEQTFTVDGTVTLPSGVVNPDSISLDVTISVTANAAASTDKTLVSITAPTAITGVANGTAKTASAMGLSTKVTLVTDDGNVQANVTWAVYGCPYDPSVTTEQTFMVDGTVTLPSGVINPRSISLSTSITVTVNAATTTDKILVSVATPSAITGVANGTAKTASALGLPSTVTLVTNGGNVSASVSWDVASSSYNASSSRAQTFTVNGTVALPHGVINPDSIPLTTSISVSVKKASSSGGGGGSSSNGTNVTIQPDKRPDQPVMAGFSATPTVNSSGHATVAISQQSVEDAIAKALADAKAQGSSANGIGISLNIYLPDTAKSLGIVLPQATLQSLVNAGVRQLEINGVIVSLDLDLEALKEIQRQSTGDVTIAIKPVKNLSAAAKKIIGTRSVYDVTISYVKDGKTMNITSLGKGSATLSLPYKPGINEAVGWLFGVHVDGKGNATRIPGSSYDMNSGSILLDVEHLSIYGVGYTAPTEKYTDIATHWAKESIDYVVGRGLFSGTTDTNFSPNTAMDRGMLVTVLGRLVGADVGAYKTSSFTDVGAGKYYLPYVEWAYKKGITSGIGNGKFAPERAVTREEFALILQNYAKATGYTLPVTREAITFADNSSIGSSYAAAVRAMQQAGIMMGGLNNKFNPQTGATRAEVATILHRYVKLTIDPATAQSWAKNDDGRYLYYKDGRPLTGWQVVGGVRYFFNTNGTLQTGWVKDGDNWHFYSGNRALVGWWDIGSETSKKRYYFDVNAVMVSGKWLQIDGKWYYFYTDGSLARGTTIDGYEVDENGVKKSK